MTSGVPDQLAGRGPQPDASGSGRTPLASWIGRLRQWAGIAPYTLFVAIFLIIPIVANVWTSIRSDGQFSGQPLSQLWQPQYRNAFETSIRLSLVTAIVGGALGLTLSWALATARRPTWLRSVVQSFSAVASQSGGVALAFAFVAAIGTQGLVTRALENSVGLDISNSLKLTNFMGLAVVYLYFQVPLMAILMLPAVEGIRKEWSEAALSLGASKLQYFRHIVTPILIPSVGGALLVLFANSFSAYATAYALTGGSVNLVPVLVGFYISGNVTTNDTLAASLVTGMMVVVVISMVLRSVVLRRTTRWLR
ncbi:ABC transporter permease [Flexivirga caeni]|uniref:ABC transporter permease subunit n=1 Tax=Flexivirga caeni TaxID=2294115 RepID=A0A3M9M0A0_9MICO|nr:ABC transporter permease subunit [Flexivirga caeni]RNI18994.1 ABC transporter permease subunit [Flexivirga caeni]